jgi:thioredoxin reductase (NADPH)
MAKSKKKPARKKNKGNNLKKEKLKDEPESEEDKWFIPEDVRTQVIEHFKDLKDEVFLEIFIKEGENDPYNAFASFFSIDLSRISDKIKVNINMIGDEKSKKYKVESSPTIVINPDQYNIRYMGAPAGEEGRSFMKAIQMVSNSDSGLSDKSRESLSELTEEREVKIFVTPTCPYCPEQVINAFRAAVERPDIVSVECIEATQNMSIAKEYKVGAVPHTVINDKTTSKGLEPEEVFINELITMEESPILKEELDDLDEEENEVDLIIIGGGPAGLTAGIYAQRSGLNSIVLEKSVLGGQVSLTPVVENYPGFTNVGGKQLMDLISAHAKNYVPIHEGEEIMEIKVGKKVEAITTKGKYLADGLILATGAQHRKLGVPGEDLYNGRGISYCATCDGYLFKDQKVIVVGGGNSAMTEALFLKNLGAEVKIIHRKDTLRAQKYLQESVEREEIPIIWDTVVDEIHGKDMALTSVKLRNTKTDEITTMDVNAVFVAIGYIPNSSIAAEIGVKLKDEGFIDVDVGCRTNIPRIYAAGDVTGGVRQIVTAVSEGSISALSAFEDIMNPYWLRREKK